MGEQQVIVSDKLPSGFHEMPEQWLRARVRGWMELNESPGENFWIGTHTSDGKWIWCSSGPDKWAPSPGRQEFAMRVCAFVNREAARGGAWLAGWVRGGDEFYMLWKDPDGDITCPIEFQKPYSVLQQWPLTTFAQHAERAVTITLGWRQDIDTSKNQRVKLAQGEKPSASHGSEAEKYVIAK